MQQQDPQTQNPLKGVNKSTLPPNNNLKKTYFPTGKRASDPTKLKKASLSSSNHTAETSSLDKPLQPVLHKASFVAEKCDEHPGETLQFYCLSLNKALCPTCLLSGIYAGQETLSIKKASETIKHRLSDLLIEMQGKLDNYDFFLKKVGNRREELKDTAVGYMRDILANIAQVVSRLQSKEKEILGLIEQIEKAKLEELNSASQKLKTQEEGVYHKRRELEVRIKELSGLSLCNYYSKNVKALTSCMEDTGLPDVQEAKIIAEASINLQAKVNLDVFKDTIRNITSEIEKLSITPPPPEPQEAHMPDTDRLHEYRKHVEKEYEGLLERELELSQPAASAKSKSNLGKYLPSSGVKEAMVFTPLGGNNDRPVRESSLSRKKFSLREETNDINDILMNGYKRLQEMKAMSPAYVPSSTKNKRKEDLLGIGELLRASTRGSVSTLGPQLMSSKSEISIKTLLNEQRFPGRENKENKGAITPNRTTDGGKFSIRDKLNARELLSNWENGVSRDRSWKHA